MQDHPTLTDLSPAVADRLEQYAAKAEELLADWPEAVAVTMADVLSKMPEDEALTLYYEVGRQAGLRPAPGPPPIPPSWWERNVTRRGER